MLVLRDHTDVSRIAHPHIRALVDLRYTQLGTFQDGLLVVVEVGDSVEQLERHCGLAILHDPYSDVPFGHPDFTSSFDYIEAHYANDSISCFEAHADTGDDGLGITLFVPAEEGISASLLAMCSQYAVSSTAAVDAG